MTVTVTRTIRARRFQAGATFVGSLNRGAPLSGSEAFHAYQSQPNVEYHSCEHCNLPHNSRIAWDQSKMEVREFVQVNFTPRAQIHLTMPWEGKIRYASIARRRRSSGCEGTRRGAQRLAGKELSPGT